MSDLAIKFIEPTRWLLILAIALTLAKAGWFFVVGPDTNPSENTSASTPSSLAQVGIERITSLNLFGNPPTTLSAEQYDIPPDTTLNLELVGVFESTNNLKSIAMIITEGNLAKAYSVGDTLPGGLKLIKVDTDRIVISRTGIHETLRFDKYPPLIVFDPNTAAEPLPGNKTFEESIEKTFGNRAPTSLHNFVSGYRQRLNDDPVETLSEIGIRAISPMEARGYQIGKLAESRYLSQTGLQPGDVILSVNGQPVGDIRQDRLEIDNIMAQGSAKFEVQRGTRRFFLTTSLK